MKLWAILLAPTVACASPVFDGYENYYSTLPTPLFKAAEKISLQPYSMRPDNDVKLAWNGEINGTRHRLALDKGTIWLDSQSFNIKKAQAFPNETLDVSDLGIGTKGFFARSYACLENTPASASGTAVRHKSVYLIRTNAKPKAFKLPSLFASCLGIWLIDGQPAFNKVEYRYEDQQDQPSGVTFTEYLLRGNAFIATGHKVFARFVEQENVYRFSVETEER